MTEHYVTLFDSTYLPNGLALHASLQRHDPDSILWVLCLDQTTLDALESLGLKGLRTITLAEAETPELLAVKSQRSIAEYCWTLTPFTHDLVFNREPSAQRVTYLDADLWFLKSPKPLFEELEIGNGNALITEHAFSPEYAHNEIFGKFCVQFMPFTREGGKHIRTWWQERVLEWCFARAEDGKFGDQKYLDDWPIRFAPEVISLSNTNLTQAPWNAVTSDPKDAVLFHFHRLRLVSEHKATVGSYRLPNKTVKEIYSPYLSEISLILARLNELGIPLKLQQKMPSGLPLVKEYLDFKRHTWRSPAARHSLNF